MEFITLSEKQLTQPNGYVDIKIPHLLISIRNPKQHIEIPANHYCKEIFPVEFIDTEEISPDSFNKDLAVSILKFMNSHCNEAELVIVHCGAGVSRSVAVASALSKIINHKDDDVFSYGVPNMLTYLTILDTYFSERHKEWSSLFYLREKSMMESLDPAVFRIWKRKVSK